MGGGVHGGTKLVREAQSWPTQLQSTSRVAKPCHFAQGLNLLPFCWAQAALLAVRNWAYAAQTPLWHRLAGAGCLGVPPSRPASGTMGCTQDTAVPLSGRGL